MNDAAARHLVACEGFSTVVRMSDGRWSIPTPCPGWDARALVEHVIGFHDVLLLRPHGAKPERPKGDPVGRWQLTETAIAKVLEDMESTRVDEREPSAEKTRSAQAGARGVDLDVLSGIDVRRLLPMLTTEVLVHTWDLARASGTDAALDPDMCESAYRLAAQSADRLRASAMFEAPVTVDPDADPQTRLIALLGRNPEWVAP